MPFYPTIFIIAIVIYLVYDHTHRKKDDEAWNGVEIGAKADIQKERAFEMIKKKKDFKGNKIEHDQISQKKSEWLIGRAFRYLSEDCNYIDGAIKDLNEALIIDKDSIYIGARVELARLYVEQDKDSEALKIIKPLELPKSIECRDISLYFKLGKIYLSLSQDDDAYELFKVIALIDYTFDPNPFDLVESMLRKENAEIEMINKSKEYVNQIVEKMIKQVNIDSKNEKN